MHGHSIEATARDLVHNHILLMDFFAKISVRNPVFKDCKKKHALVPSFLILKLIILVLILILIEFFF